MKTVAAMLALASAAIAAPFRVAPLVEPSPEARVVPGSYIVTLHDSVSVAAGQDFAKKFDARYFNVGGTFAGFHGSFDEDTVERLRAHGDLIKEIEQDTFVWALGEQQNPPSWGQDRSDQRNRPLDNYWRYADAAGSGVDAYILDTGIRITHNDFGNRARYGFKANPSWNDNDGNGHGTHVAGTVAGTSHGLAKSSGLVGVKVLSDFGAGSTTGVVEGVEYTANEGRSNRDVANMSLGGGASAALDNAVNAAVSAGITFAVAAGNDNRDACNYSPARASGPMTVGSTDSNDNRSSFSNYGTCVDIFAPGSSITSAWITNDSSTRTISGTSMASPHVCGVMALEQSISNGSPSAIEGRLTNDATSGVVNNPGSGSPNLLLYHNYSQ
eukprot:NODE_465_length_1471_cov_120.726935_g433_i0.p1 GENE.NODE_465_length_1471_cov_120.726935_g433_i0~~NODE_465_length_1471_cov_120.726935_g433_i0.p1  ORF type:complete len:385 (-),score=140.24 NODE_465_length_1471_cov_120.726935_g433_i0:57-1211(-)